MNLYLYLKSIFLLCLLVAYLQLVCNIDNVYAQKKVENVIDNLNKMKKESFKIRINKGNVHTNKREILLEIATITTQRELISNCRIAFNMDSLLQVKWTPVGSWKHKIFYSGEEGKVDVYVQLRDKPGNVSEVEKASFYLDETPPEKGRIVINKGAKFSSNNSMKVRLSLIHDDAYKMQISNSSNFTLKTWESFVPNKVWTMGAKGEGVRTVYVRFADQAGNVSATVSNSIVFDHEKPKGTVSINNGQKYTNSRLVILSIKGSSDTSIARIIGANAVENVPYFEDDKEKIMIKDWYLDSIQGIKRIRVLFRDRAGNISETAAEDDIFLDTKAPAISYFKINRGRKFVNDKEGKVSLYIGTKTIDIDFVMLISSDSTFDGATPQKFSGIVKDFKLPNEKDGIKNVYLKFVDKAGNESKVAKASTFLDRESPTINSFVINNDEKFTKSRNVKLNSEVEEVLAVQYSNVPSFVKSNWERYSPLRTNWLTLSNDGLITIYAKFRDRAGNETVVFSDTIIKDVVPPKGRIAINNGKKITNNDIVTLKILYSPGTSEMKISRVPKFDNSSWEKLKKLITDYKLSEGDGEKRCYVKFRDSANNISNIYVARIILDKTPPTNPSIVINNDSLFTNRMDRIVKLSLKVEGARAMLLSEDKDFKNVKPKKHLPITAITLSQKEGEKTVYAQFIDQVGNKSEVVSDTIILDRYPPKLKSFKIDNDAEWTNNKEKKVTLSIDAVGDPIMMLITTNPKIENSSWIPFKSEVKDYVLEGEDGYKILYIFLKDKYDKISKVDKASIKLKRTF